MFAGKTGTISRTYVMSNSLSYYSPFFYTILLCLSLSFPLCLCLSTPFLLPPVFFYSLLFVFFSSFFLRAHLSLGFSFSLTLSLNHQPESVFVPLNTIEKSIETRPTIFHSEKGFLGSEKKEESRNALFTPAFTQRIWISYICTKYR